MFVLRAGIEEFWRKCDRRSRSSFDADRRDNRHEFRDLMAVMQGMKSKRRQGCGSIHNSAQSKSRLHETNWDVSSRQVHLPQCDSFHIIIMAIHTSHRLPIVLGAIASLLFIIAAFHQRGGVPNAKKLWRYEQMLNKNVFSH